MPYKLLSAVPLCLAVQIAFAQSPEKYDGSQYDGYQPIVEDREPNWETAAYACPLSIKTAKGEFKFSEFRLNNAGEPMAMLRAEPRKYLLYNFNGKKDFDLTCEYGEHGEYKDYEMSFVMPSLKGLTACGRNDKPPPYMACWTVDPYAGKK